MFDKIFDRASGVFQSAQESVATKSALNPLLWLNAIWLFFVFLMVGLSWWNDRDEFILPLLFSVLVLLSADLLAFFYLLFFAPNRLQSETYTLTREQQEAILQSAAPEPE